MNGGPDIDGRHAAWLRTVTDWNPVSAVTAAVRELCGTRRRRRTGHGRWSTRCSPRWAGRRFLLLVFVPLCTARYARPRG
ncbi:hypothetical protein [Pseudonocardia sp.]|uniref:hypothetical protein n=1 Tax=Pseudonocardia sp. TaxID=60912 RepID=UPI0031FBE323